MKILIVDDSLVMRNIIRRSLRQGGIDAEVLEAPDGVEALKHLDAQPDVILCDWNMPNMDGLTFVKTVREQNIQIPIVMVTSEGESSRISEAEAAGASGHITKPFTPEVLANTISELAPV